jgi:hypothetical protein
MYIIARCSKSGEWAVMYIIARCSKSGEWAVMYILARWEHLAIIYMTAHSPDLEHLAILYMTAHSPDLEHERSCILLLDVSNLSLYLQYSDLFWRYDSFLFFNICLGFFFFSKIYIPLNVCCYIAKPTACKYIYSTLWCFIDDHETNQENTPYYGEVGFAL